MTIQLSSGLPVSPNLSSQAISHKYGDYSLSLDMLQKLCLSYYKGLDFGTTQMFR